MCQYDNTVNILLSLSIYTGVVFLAWGMTAWVRRYALNRMILDYPNQRSLHSVPTPRGGGISITLVVLICAVVLWSTGSLSYQVVLAVVGGGLLVAVVGWLDDNFNVAILWRASCYLLAAVWVCYWTFEDNGVTGQFTIISYIFWCLILAWMTNLYNFMDGSDGLAASQAICTALMGSILLAEQTGLSILLLVLSAACTGFLIWNWPPAKVFMGDVGSCVIGFVFGTMALVTWTNGTMSPAIWLILLSVFICDSSLTLVKRLFTGEKWYQAHRKHAYQLLVRTGCSHKQLVYLVLLINCLFLLPLSYIATQNREYEWSITAAVYTLSGSLWLLIQLKYRQPGTE